MQTETVYQYLRRCDARRKARALAARRRDDRIMLSLCVLLLIVARLVTL